jgi:TolB protein
MTVSDLPELELSRSPDGVKFIFTRGDGSEADIYMMNIDGSNQTRITENNFRETTLAWSPDSKSITFVSERDGNMEIYTLQIR